MIFIAGPIEFSWYVQPFFVAFLYGPWILALAAILTLATWFVQRRRRRVSRVLLAKVFFGCLIVSFVVSWAHFTTYANKQHNAPGADYEACLVEGKTPQDCARYRDY